MGVGGSTQAVVLLERIIEQLQMEGWDIAFARDHVPVDSEKMIQPKKAMLLLTL
jgi:hypothetical protein